MVMTPFSDNFFKKIAQSLQEEEIDVYVMNLYYRNRDDIKFFSEKDRKRVQEIFDILIADTKRHAELLQLIVELGGSK